MPVLSLPVAHSPFNSSIFRAYGTSLFSVASGLVTNLWFLREITKAVSAHDFGVYAFILQIAGYLTLLQLGLDLAASRQIAESLGKDDLLGARRIYEYLIRFNRRASLAAAAVVLLLSLLLQYGLVFPRSIDAASTHLAAQIALVTGAAQVIPFFARPYSAALIGSQIQSTVNILMALRTVVTTLLAFGLLKAGFYILSIPIAEIITQLAYSFLLRHQVRLKCLWSSGPFERVSKGEMEEKALSFAGLSSLGGFAWTVEAGMDVVLLGAQTNSSAVTTYVLWWRFPQMIFDLSTRLAASAFPRFSNSFGISRDAARAIFTKIAIVSLGISTLALVGIGLWLPSFLQLWIGKSYLDRQSPYLAFAIGLLVCLRIWGNLLATFWMASGRAGFTTALSWAQAAFKLTMALLLISRFGILGLVIASCCSSMIQVGGMAWLLLRENLLVREFITKAIAFIFLALLASFIAARMVIQVGWPTFILGTGATTLFWFLCWFFLICTKELRSSVLVRSATVPKTR